MNAWQGRIPHALATAHRELSAALDEGIRQFKANRRFANAHDVCRAAERFIDAFHQQTGGRNELRRRALLVETACGAGSECQAARAAALQVYQFPASRLPGSNPSIGGLGEATTPPQYLSEVTLERNLIEQALLADPLNATPGAREAYRRWASACREVQREADALEVDGCWWLFHLHVAGEHEPTEVAEVARAITHSNIGGANLEAMKAAADSLANWAAESRTDQFSNVGSTLEALAVRQLNPDISNAIAEADRGADRPGGEPAKPFAESGGVPSTPTKSKRSTQRGEGRAKLIAALTKHHKYAEGGCLNLEPIGNNKLARLAGVAKRTASAFFSKEFHGHDMYRAMCNDQHRLVAAIKTLRGEFRPHQFHDARTPDDLEQEDEQED